MVHKFSPLLWIRIFNNGGITVESQFTAFVEPPPAFLILRTWSGMESMRLCKRDKSTSSHNLRIAFHSFLCCELFALKSLVEDGPKVLDRVNVITFGGPSFHHRNLMPLQPSLRGLCRVASRVLSCCSSHPSFLFVSKPLFRGRQQRVLQNVLIHGCVESVFIESQVRLALPAESSPRINPSTPTAPSPSQELHPQIWPRQTCVAGCLL